MSARLTVQSVLANARALSKVSIRPLVGWTPTCGQEHTQISCVSGGSAYRPYWHASGSAGLTTNTLDFPQVRVRYLLSTFAVSSGAECECVNWTSANEMELLCI